MGALTAYLDKTHDMRELCSMVTTTNVCPWCRRVIASRASCVRHVWAMSRTSPMRCPTRAVSFEFAPVEASAYT
eukprot:2835468-Pyramimonas_sp.AAC.1